MKHKFLKLASFLFATAALSSCLKDKGYDNNEYQLLRGSDPASQKVVSIALTTATNDNVTISPFNAISTPVTIAFVPVTLSGGFPAPQDVHVTLDTSNALVAAYNAANPSNPFVFAPVGSYTIESKSITIPKGQTTAYVKITFTPVNYLGNPVGIGWKIVSVDGGYAIASNGKGTGVAAITIRNAYDGVYDAVGYFYHPSSPRAINLTGANGVAVGTVNANTVVTQLGDLGNPVNITVDPVTFVVTSLTDGGAPPGIAPTSLLATLPAPYTPFPGSNPSIYNNTYNPTTHQFFLRYGYLGSTGYRVVEEVLTLQ